MIGSHRELVIYVAATATLAALGVLLKSYVLNWIVGPMLGVVLVLAISRLLEPPARRRR